MPQINVLGWNLENFGVSKYRATNGGQELIALVAKVIAQRGVLRDPLEARRDDRRRPGVEAQRGDRRFDVGRQAQ
jgi:hypothetical protein